MLPRTDKVQAVSAISREVEGVCAMLTAPSPDALERCEGILHGVVSSFSALQPELAPAGRDPAVRNAVLRLRRSLERARGLLDTAFHYHDQWRVRMAASLAGYTRDGCPAALPQAAHLSWRG
jgi:hypothetical protein